VDRIGQVVLQAASGDTILVGPGTYFEHIPLDGKSLVLQSTMGPDATILDGSVPIGGREGSIGYLRSTTEAEPASIAGFTLTHGQGTLDPNGWRVGGALAFIGSPIRVRIQDCTFVDNRMSGGGATAGGAMSLEVEEATIVNCRFRGNAPGTGGMGGDLVVLSGRVTIDHCLFEIAAEADERGVCMWSWSSPLTITDSEFRSSESADGASIVSLGLNVSLLRNRFMATNGRLATSITLSQDFVGVFHQEFRISENLFWNSNPDESGWQTAFELGGPDVHIQLDHNDFIGCGVSCEFDGDPLVCDHNIFYKSRFEHLVPPSVATCNCVSDSTYWQPHQYSHLEYEDMVFGDPMFCRVDTGDFGLSSHSPCAAEQSPAGCGLIGLFGIACDATPVRETSWGRLKARYLRK
jgi:hypothetical protein